MRFATELESIPGCVGLGQSGEAESGEGTIPVTGSGNA